MSEAVKVIVRCRPINKRELDLKSKTVIQIDSSTGHCDLINPIDEKVKSFIFDGAYSTESTTEQIYNEIVFPLVESVTEGYNATVFAYGQTGSGKSFTMQGVSNVAQRGIIPRSFEHIFESISVSENYKYLIHASYLEIYNEEIRDLLGEDVKKKLELKEHNETGVYVNELSLHPIHNVQECEKLMEKGWKNRSVGATLMNTDSSRSHSIFTLYVERMKNQTENCEEIHSFFKKNTRSKDQSASSIRRGKLNLVDLAGSERQAKTGAVGDRFKEATKINLSLSALGNVISALVDGKQKYIPYRDSKLTRLLQDSLGGNTKTLMVACLSPSDNNYDETLSTLRYANRAKSIQNKPKINEDPKDALLREYQEEIAKLRTLLDKTSMLDKTGNQSQNAKDDESVEKIKEDYDRKMEELISKYKEEQANHERLKSDLLTLKQNYEVQLKQKDHSNPNKENIEIIKDNMKQGELLIKERLKELQNQMIGGEKANDSHLKEKRANRKKLADAKINAIKDALTRVDDEDNLLIKAYGDITEELKNKNQLLKKAKKRLNCLEQDVKDLQSEFEVERQDYLETIRKQEQQTKLLNQIIEKFQQIVHGKDVNYGNLEKIKKECKWDYEKELWYLPEIVYYRTKLPPTDFNNNSSNEFDLIEEDLFNVDDRIDQSPTIYTNGTNNLSSKAIKDRLFQKLEKNVKSNLAANYFKPKRQEQLLNSVQTYLNNNDENRMLTNSDQADSPKVNGRKVNELDEHSDFSRTTRHDRAKSFLISTLNNINKNFDDLNGSFSAIESTAKRKPNRLESLNNKNNGNP